MQCNVGRMFDAVAHYRHYVNIDIIYHWIGFFFLVPDFVLSGIPVRLLHFVQPLGFSLVYNICLMVFTYFTHDQDPFYRAADYFSDINAVSRDLKKVLMFFFSIRVTYFSFFPTFLTFLAVTEIYHAARTLVRTYSAETTTQI